jgi:hypothetical protein
MHALQGSDEMCWRHYTDRDNGADLNDKTYNRLKKQAFRLGYRLMLDTVSPPPKASRQGKRKGLREGRPGGKEDDGGRRFSAEARVRSAT